MVREQDKGVGIPNDTIQLRTRIAKVWTKGSRCSREIVNATARNGYLDSNQPDKARKRGKDVSAIVSPASEGEANWNNKGMGFH
jgi:hypothetical protein